jgi:hypothetical protein
MGRRVARYRVGAGWGGIEAAISSTTKRPFPRGLGSRGRTTCVTAPDGAPERLLTFMDCAPRRRDRRNSDPSPAGVTGTGGRGLAPSCVAVNRQVRAVNRRRRSGPPATADCRVQQ